MVDVIQSGILTNATLTNGRAFGTIETPGDIDMYKVYLTAGNYHINLGGDPLFGTALSDTIVRIYNSSGHLLSVDDDNGLGSSSYIDFVTGSSGYYYIAASGFTSGTGDYALALTADNVSAGQVEGILEVGMSITGRVDENFEADTYNVYLEAGITYYFKLEAQGGVDGPNSNPIKPLDDGMVLHIVGVTEITSPNTEITRTHTATSSGWHTINVKGADYYDDGHYTLSVTSNAPPTGHRPSASNGTITIAEDVARSFSSSTFSMTDGDGDSLSGIYVMSLPSVGSLTYAYQPVQVGQWIPAHSLASLVWTPPANASGMAMTGFDFVVVDDSSHSAADPTPNRITFNVHAANDAPVITSGAGQASATVYVSENSRTVTTVRASDPDNTPTYAIAGTDAAQFTINATTGALAFRSTPDFEAARDAGRNNVYNVTVLATDGSLTDGQTLAITVRNIAGNSIAGTNGNNTVDASHAINSKSATNEEDRIDGKGGNDKLNGLAGNDTIIGGAGKDTLTGGAGFDRLDGGKDADRFVFSAKLNAAGVDTIVRFEHDKDKLALENKVFKALGSSITADEFYAKAGATQAKDKSDHIVYNKSTGQLYYDADGKGGAAAVLFATLSNKPKLDHGDFVIV